LTVTNGDVYTSLRQVVSDKERFEHSEGTPYPVARLETSQARGYVQLKPDFVPEQPLLPAEQDDLGRKMWERLKSLSDLEADVLDILVSEWLKQAKTPNDRALIRVDDMIALRGLKPKKNGKGRGSGYTPEQRRIHLRAAAVIFDLWLNMHEVVYYTGNGKRPHKLSFESRPFVITDRLGELRLYDEYIDVLAFKYVPGDVFAVFLMGNHQTALLSARALEYNFRTQTWHKRLTRYYSYLWGCKAAGRDYEKPVKISDIFRDCLRIEIDTRWLAQTKARFVACHRTLKRDGVVAGWRYEQQDGPWSEWMIVVEPPDEIRRSHEGGPQAVPSFELPPRLKSPSGIDECGERIRAKRESLGLPQRQLAKLRNPMTVGAGYLFRIATLRSGPGRRGDPGRKQLPAFPRPWLSRAPHIGSCCRRESRGTPASCRRRSRIIYMPPFDAEYCSVLATGT
jgi:hypothetical protein